MLLFPLTWPLWATALPMVAYYEWCYAYQRANGPPYLRTGSVLEPEHDVQDDNGWRKS